MPAEFAYDYAIVRLVPRVDRGEMINVGVILSCPEASFLDARIEVDSERARALDGSLDLEAVRDTLATIPIICAGGAAAGPVGVLPQRNRFHWLVAPRSTVVQTSAVHTGRTSDPEATLEHLLDTMVRRPQSAGNGGT